MVSSFSQFFGSNYTKPHDLKVSLNCFSTLQLLKPSFAILCDRNSKCFLLLIRGTHSIKDTLTAATGAVVPFHHSALHEGVVSSPVLGYAHYGMAVAARWIAKCTTSTLLRAVNQYKDYNIKVDFSNFMNIPNKLSMTNLTCFTFSPCMEYHTISKQSNYRCNNCCEENSFQGLLA